MKRYNMPIQRHEFLDGESYGKRYQMVEEANGDWVWYEDVEALEAKCAELDSECAELLVACKGLLGIAERHGWLHVAVDAAKAAIAKAEGGSHENQPL